MTTCKCSEIEWHPYPEEPVTADYTVEQTISVISDIALITMSIAIAYAVWMDG